MADLLERMARSSRRRVADARGRESAAALRRRAADTAPPALLELSPRGFDLIAEIKRRAPSAGRFDFAETVGRRAALYAGAGAAAVSVLTEPDEFAGSLDDLREASRAAPVPVMRKDFLVDPYQVFEARAAGAAGVLLILRLVGDGTLAELLDAAHETKMFVLLEAFDGADLERLRALETRAGAGPIRLVGVNARDLVSLEIDAGRFARLVPALPDGLPRVAESGLESGADARRVSALGYRLALVGGALMRAPDPALRIAEMIEEGRQEGTRPCACE